MTEKNINEVLTRIEQMPRGVFLFAPKIPVSQMVCKTDDLFTLAAAYKRLQADNAALRELLKDSTPKKFAVIYGNYYPREVDSYWATKEEAEAEVERLNDEMRVGGLGSGMWEVEAI